MVLYLERTYSKQTYPYTATAFVGALAGGGNTELVALSADRAIFVYKVVISSNVAGYFQFQSGGILNIMEFYLQANTPTIFDFYDYGIIGGYVGQNFRLRNAGGVPVDIDWFVVYNYIRV